MNSFTFKDKVKKLVIINIEKKLQNTYVTSDTTSFHPITEFLKFSFILHKSTLVKRNNKHAIFQYILPLKYRSNLPT